MTHSWLSLEWPVCLVLHKVNRPEEEGRKAEEPLNTKLQSNMPGRSTVGYVPNEGHLTVLIKN